MTSHEHKLPERPGLAVAVEGEGVSPTDLTIQHLAELLDATASVLSALGPERAQRARPYLQAVRKGSAELVLESPEIDWEELANDFYDAAKSRGAGLAISVKRALMRLFKAGRIGGIRIAVIGGRDSTRAAPIRLAAPIDERGSLVEWTTTVFGRLVGVNIFADHSTVKVELADGGRQDYEVDTSVAEKAARLFNKPVRGEVYFVSAGERFEAQGLTSIELWLETDFLEDLRAIRSDLKKSGVAVNPEDWIRELE